MDNLNLFWFRRDLRLHDNHGLYRALKSGNKVLPFFLFDKEILDDLEDVHDARLTFIHQTLTGLKAELKKHGSDLLVEYGNPLPVFEQLLNTYPIESVYTNHDYEPRAILRDAKIESLLKSRGISYFSFKDQVIFEKDEVLKNDGTPYLIFTPYSRAWKKRLLDNPVNNYPSETLLKNLHGLQDSSLPGLERMGFQASTRRFPASEVSENLIWEYDKARDYPAMAGTSRLGIHLRFGTISIREKVMAASRMNEKFLNELIWRDFYQTILAQFPRVEKHAFKPAFDGIPWRNVLTEFEAWCMGKTGYPLVDAGMRELNETGFMHNRVRMVAAGFLCKQLLIDWRWGEAWFAARLLDFELASNNGNWQWVAGCGVDATPYFRVFNPQLQLEKFDQDNIYIKRWIPEWGTPAYPEPIVDNNFARKRCIEVYKTALQQPLQFLP